MRVISIATDSELRMFPIIKAGTPASAIAAAFRLLEGSDSAAAKFVDALPSDMSVKEIKSAVSVRYDWDIEYLDVSAFGSFYPYPVSNFNCRCFTNATSRTIPKWPALISIE